MISKSNGNALDTKADAAFEEVARDVIARAKLAKTEIVIWRDGKVAKLSPEEMERSLGGRATESGADTAE